MTLNEYITSNRRLTRSITVKSSHQATLVNDNIISTKGSLAVDLEDHTTWRYYLNSNGEYHITNTPIYIYVLETGRLELLSKSLLISNPLTRDELNKFGVLYNRVVSEYPTEETLIKGILNPIDVETMYSLKDGEISTYSSHYVSTEELSIMDDLNRYSLNTYTRWMNANYISMDYRYFIIFLGGLYLNIGTKIELLRLENIHTHKVHDFHLENFFKSTLDIDTTYYNRSSKLWLYQNLRTLSIHAGTEETLTQIIDNVLTPNSIGVGKVIVDKAKPIISGNQNDTTKATYVDEDISSLFVKALNDEYNVDGMTLSELISAQVDNGFINTDTSELLETIEKKIMLNNETNLNTKIIHVALDGIVEMMEHSRVAIMIDSILNLANSSDSNLTTTIVDPNTNNTINLNLGQLSRLLVFLLLGHSGDSTSGEVSITLNHCVNSPIHPDITKLMLPDGDFNYIDVLISSIPEIDERYTSATTIETYVNNVLDYYRLNWTISSIVDSSVSMENIRVFNRHTQTTDITISTDNIISELGMTITSDYNYISMILAILRTIMSSSIVDVTSIGVDKINSYVDLLKKTTSYNLQVLNSTTSFNTFECYDVGIDMLTAVPIPTFEAVLFNPLENIICNVKKYDVGGHVELKTQSNLMIIPHSELMDAGHGTMSELTTLPLTPLTLELNDASPYGISSDGISISYPKAELVYDAGYASEDTKLVSVTYEQTDSMITDTVYIGGELVLISETINK